MMFLILFNQNGLMPVLCKFYNAAWNQPTLVHLTINWVFFQQKWEHALNYFASQIICTCVSWLTEESCSTTTPIFLIMIPKNLMKWHRFTLNQIKNVTKINYGDSRHIINWPSIVYNNNFITEMQITINYSNSNYYLYLK